MRKSCEGKLEIKNLFNLIEEHIDVPNLLTKFNEDLEKYNLLKILNLIEILCILMRANFIPNGKFVFFVGETK